MIKVLFTNEFMDNGLYRISCPVARNAALSDDSIQN